MLSQSEIDDVVAGANPIAQDQNKASEAELTEKKTSDKGEGEEHKVRPYNFWSPDRVSKEQMRAVELVHEDIAERLNSSLPPYLRTELRIRVSHVEQGRFDDFMRDLPPNILFHLLNLDPLPSRMVLTVSPEVSWSMVGRLLGGSGDMGTDVGGMTDIGQSLMRILVEGMLNDVKAAWSKVVSLDPELEDSTSNYHWVQMIMGNARVLRVVLELVVSGLAGHMMIYIPLAMLKPITNVLNPHVFIAGRERHQSDPELREKVLRSLSEVNLPIRVLLGTVDLKVDEIAGLQPGDIVRLDSYADCPLSVHIAEKPCFFAKVGKVGKRLAVEIQSDMDRMR